MADIKKAINDEDLENINGGRIVPLGQEEGKRPVNNFLKALLIRDVSDEEKLATVKRLNNSMVGDRQMSEEDMDQIASLVRDKFKGQL